MGIVTRGLNLGYRLASTAMQGKLKAMAGRYPKAFVMNPEQVETQAAYIVAPTLQHIILDVTGEEPRLEDIQNTVIEGYKSGLFNNFGKRVYINKHRIPELMLELDIDSSLRENFIKQATRHGVLRSSVLFSQVAGALTNTPRAPERGQYLERPYSLITRDDTLLQLNRLINQRTVKTNDDSPSILLVPGIGCKGKFFDLNNDQFSLALLLADIGSWVYKFDFRGLGSNKGNFDPQCFFDTLVSNDLPAGLDFICHRPTPNKPVIIIAHSMGGMVAEFLLVRQAYKLRRLLAQIGIDSKGMTRPQIEEAMNSYMGTDREAEIIIAEARTHLEMLKTVKGLISIASSRIFDKSQNYIFPMLLSLNLLLPILGEESVPIDKFKKKWLIKMIPFELFPLKSLINPDNFKKVKAFVSLLIEEGVDSFPLGVGFQMLRAIFSGQGIKRMDQSRFNYSAHLDEIPPDIPISHLYFSKDPLAAPYNLTFVDKGYAHGTDLDFSRFPEYQHDHCAVHHIKADTSVEEIELPQSPSQVQGFLIDGASHLDAFYGKVADEKTIPLLLKLIQTIEQIT